MSGERVGGRAHGVPRIAFVESYPRALYGQQRTLLALLDHLPGDEVFPLVVVPGDGAFLDAAWQRDLEVCMLRYPGLLAAYGGAVYRYRGLGRIRFFAQAFGYFLQSRRLLECRKVQGVFCNDLRGLLTIGFAARSLGIPVMIWDKLDRPHGWLDWLELPLANRVAVISEAVKGKFPRWQTWLYRDRVHVVSEGVDLQTLDRSQSLRAELGIGAGEIVLGVVGSITPRKGQDRLLGILPQLLIEVPGALVLVVGDVSELSEEREYARSLPHRDHPRVRFLGMRRDVPAIMKSIDILVAPSRQEGLGMVLLEAMASRRPVVGARSGGIPEVVVHGETGLLVDGDDSEGLLTSLVQLCRSPALRAQMGAAGRRRVEQRYRRDIQMKRIGELLLGLVESAGRR